MNKRITLVDVFHPDEPLEVEIEQFSESTLRLTIPNTHVSFELRRRNQGMPFEGELGGRYFTIDLKINLGEEIPARTRTIKRRSSAQV